jgi:hypothetical protein
MTAKAKIKVIKKSEFKTAGKSAKSGVVEKHTTQAAAREMVSTVTTWVSDFQQRRRDETRQAIEKFFTPQTQTSRA